MGKAGRVLHPWSNITDTFVSLTSEISSRVPTITRATSTIPLLPLRRTRIPHMHANPSSSSSVTSPPLYHVISATAYDIYATRVQGLELLLPQSHYVRGTKNDSIPSIDKPRRVLWNVVEVMKGVVGALADSDIAERKGGEAVFIDILSISLVIQL
ncbi:hypothetical protein BDQ17DRAFT_671040 [Cyathus striatus]|nr:hypothetical protein BDQ17DRAFT_671040 [Cyathus striatus]